MPTDQEIMDLFLGLYAGAHCQKLRDAGQRNAMPPWAEVTWLGKQVSKCPMDLWVYQEIIWETKPQLIIETGTGGGGSASFFAYILDAIGEGEIVTVDNVNYKPLADATGPCPVHPRIKYMRGSSLSDAIAEQIREAATGKRTMVCLDSLHTYEHVARELELYGLLVTPGCYLVVEDTGLGIVATGNWCSRAAAEFVQAHPDFVVDKSRERHLLTSNRDGWILRKGQ